MNLPVEFNASARAKAQLVELGIVAGGPDGLRQQGAQRGGLTYVAATLQAILTLLYYIMRFSNRD